MNNLELRNAIEKMIKHCSNKIAFLKQSEACDKINEMKTEQDIGEDRTYTTLLGNIFQLLPKDGKGGFVDRLTGLPKSTYSIIDLYEQTIALLKELLACRP